MNNPDLIWRLIELLLQKENDQAQKNQNIQNNTQLNVQKHDETL